MDMADALLYDPLPVGLNSRCIRLLDVYAATTTSDDEVFRAQTRIINLNSEARPHFSALSYVWGAAEGGTHTITCDG